MEKYHLSPPRKYHLLHRGFSQVPTPFNRLIFLYCLIVVLLQTLIQCLFLRLFKEQCYHETF